MFRLAILAPLVTAAVGCSVVQTIAQPPTPAATPWPTSTVEPTAVSPTWGSSSRRDPGYERIWTPDRGTEHVYYDGQTQRRYSVYVTPTPTPTPADCSLIGPEARDAWEKGWGPNSVIDAIAREGSALRRPWGGQVDGNMARRLYLECLKPQE